ncbi:MAG: Fatty-acyl-CoA oxidase, related to yeast fatty acid beta-oxidation enzyme POX1 [uncultured Nocardioidaceae bacterium]|uniref:acyl-CoA oxidase n=1 Tax=uncultured Nocardioidaceae bacterium TaxID=253824 RepID=A0A6J4N0C5_9ACTN|nr:MAG: Fatty-acyl-CoA oxidase, related to yeast fatty acid beta-oxidation enzyme POX1 [uncultured Nocardioidaceae bacterium]
MGAMPTELDAPIDVAALTTLLDGRYKAVRDLARENLALRPDVLEKAETLSTEDYRELVKDIVVELASTGQTGWGFPKEYGGGGDIGASVAAFETSSFGDLSVVVKLGVQFGLFGGAILHLGTQRHHDEYLKRVVTGELFGAFAMTESGHGSNVQALRTTATYDGDTDEFVVNTPDDSARKDYIGNAAMHASHAAVFAQLVVGGERRGVHALVVPLRDDDGKVLPGVRIEDCGRKIGLNGVDNGRIWFDEVRVPRDALLDRYADVTDDGTYFSEIENPDRRFFTMLGTLVQGRVCVGGAAINASKVALAIAVHYAVKRRQFGPPGTDEENLLLDYGQHQRRLLPLLARTYALHFAQERVAADLHRVFSDPDSASERRRRALESRAAATKALGTWHASRTIQECREACGGAGYMSANRFDALRADTDVFTTFEGDNTILLQLVAKGRLTDLRDDFGALDQLGTARYVAGIALGTVVEKTSMRQMIERLRDAVPGSGGGGDDAGLLDPEYHLSMLRWREDHMTSSVARRIQAGVSAGGDAVEVFSRAQDHVIASAWAHAERLVFEAFLTKLQNMPDGSNRRVLNMVCDLFALSAIEADRAWFLEHGRLSTGRSKAITAMVNELCRRLRPHAVDLVDAFGVPAEMLRSDDLF